MRLRILTLFLSLVAVGFCPRPTYALTGKVCSELFKSILMLRGPVRSFDELKALERPLNDVWQSYSVDTRASTAAKIIARRILRLQLRRVYRGMWLSADELVGVIKNGMTADSDRFQNYIFFTSEIQEAIRYGAQGASMVEKQKPRAIFVLFEVHPAEGDIRIRDRPDGDGKMQAPTAINTVPADAITKVWVYDPKLGDDSIMRAIDLRAMKRDA